MQVIMGWRLSQHKHLGIYYQTTANLVQVFAQLTNTVPDEHMTVSFSSLPESGSLVDGYSCKNV
jgi:hypothetical protein